MASVSIGLICCMCDHHTTPPKPVLKMKMGDDIVYWPTNGSFLAAYNKHAFPKVNKAMFNALSL